MKLGIDATNIRSGGGVTHLLALLHSAETWKSQGIEKIVVWTHPELAARIAKSDSSIRVIVPPLSGGGYPARAAWQQFSLPSEMKKERIDLLFALGGTAPLVTSVPFVVAIQNQLPFDERSRSLFGATDPMRFKLELLRQAQARSLARASGAIFWTQDSRSQTIQEGYKVPKNTAIIPLGTDDRFFNSRAGRDDEEFSSEIRALYVSTVFPYKHHLQVVGAISALRRKGVKIHLDLVGGGPVRYVEKLHAEMRRLDPRGEFIRDHGAVDSSKIHTIYRASELFIYASSCETFGAILTEAMASGLPIVASSCGPMKEILGPNGIYFDPFSSADLERALDRMIQTPAAQRKLWVQAAQARAREFTWEKTARSTFAVLRETLDQTRLLRT